MKPQWMVFLPADGFVIHFAFNSENGTHTFVGRTGFKYVMTSTEAFDMAVAAIWRQWVKTHPGQAFVGELFVTDNAAVVAALRIDYGDQLQVRSHAIETAGYGEVFDARARWLERQQGNGGPQVTVMEFHFPPHVMERLFDVLERSVDNQLDHDDVLVLSAFSENMQYAWATSVLNDLYATRFS